MTFRSCNLPTGIATSPARFARTLSPAIAAERVYSRRKDVGNTALARSTLAARPMQEMTMADFRILSLDGGGPWALIQVMALIDLYGAEPQGQDVLRRSDLIAASSGGAILAGGLGRNSAP